MRARYFTTAVTSALLVVAAPSIADHNSKNGEGTANMPNDIHNTRVDTLETNDNEAFRDFVQYGEGSKTVNRFESEETQPNQANERQGQANATANRGESPARNQSGVNTQTGNQSGVNTQTRNQDRARFDSGARNRDRAQANTGSGNEGRARVETRTRLQPGAADRPRRDASARSTRNRDKSSRGRNK